MANWWAVVTSKKYMLLICAFLAVGYFGYFRSHSELHNFTNDVFNKDSDVNHIYSSESRVVYHGNRELNSVENIVYNRVPKCGSATTSRLIMRLGDLNKFNTMFILKVGPKNLNRTDQLEVIDRTKKALNPWIYIQHFHLVNFTAYGEDMPLHINLIRDPIERKMSAYYYLRFKAPRMMSKERRNMTFDDCVKKRDVECVNPKKLFSIVPYFCGSHVKCTEPSKWALNRAKQNVIRYYGFVGYVEEIAKFYEILEATMPQFFKGLGHLYKENKDYLKTTTSNKHSKVISQTSRNYIRSLMGYDYEFYNFIKKRFNEQYSKIILS